MQIKNFTEPSKQSLLLFGAILVLVTLFYTPALTLGRAGGDLHWYVRAETSSFSEMVQRVADFRNALEFRPLNHYLYHLGIRVCFGKNIFALHSLVLLLGAANIFLVYWLIHLITDNRRIAGFAALIFSTRVALLRTYCIASLSPPKLFFLLCLTFIFYLKSKEKRPVYLGLSVLTYLLAMLTRESFLFLIIPLFFYELFYSFDRKITTANIIQIVKKLAPYCAVIFCFMIVRLPYYLNSLALKKNHVLKVGYRDVSTNHVFINIINFIRFHFNSLALFMEDITLKSIFGLSSIDALLMISFMFFIHAFYTVVKKQRLAIPAPLKTHMLLGVIWFLSFTLLYCFLGRISIYYIYEGLLGSALIAGCIGEYYYQRFKIGESPQKKAAIYALALLFLGTFYLLTQRKLSQDDHLRSWNKSAEYVASIAGNTVKITATSRLHYYNKVPIDAYALGNIAGLGEKGGGWLFRYIFNKQNLQVIYHGSSIDPAKVSPGDVVFEVTANSIRYDTRNYGQITP